MKTCRSWAFVVFGLAPLVGAAACTGQMGRPGNGTGGAGVGGSAGNALGAAGSGGAGSGGGAGSSASGAGGAAGSPATGAAGGAGSASAGSGGSDGADAAAGAPPSSDAGPAAPCVTTATEFCDDFETGALDMQKWKMNKPSGSASITVDQMHAHGGKYAVHIKVVPNQQSTAQIVESVNFPRTPNLFYARMYAYFSPDIPASSAANPDMHSGYLLGNGNNDRGNVQAGVGLAGSGSAKQWLSFSIFYADPKFEFGPSSKSIIIANQWQCVELLEDGSDPKTEIRRVWVDDKELTELHTDSAMAAGGQTNHLPPKWASVSFGIWEYHPIPTLSDMWIDDVRVSGQKIGCSN
ncbi:MAG TPA: hypothetical protein VGK52_14480 [Polyangia bacterium]|jgi:hypothetical protein